MPIIKSSTKVVDKQANVDKKSSPTAKARPLGLAGALFLLLALLMVEGGSSLFSLSNGRAANVAAKSGARKVEEWPFAAGGLEHLAASLDSDLSLEFNEASRMVTVMYTRPKAVYRTSRLKGQGLRREALTTMG